MYLSSLNVDDNYDQWIELVPYSSFPFKLIKIFLLTLILICSDLKVKVQDKQLHRTSTNWVFKSMLMLISSVRCNHPHLVPSKLTWNLKSTDKSIRCVTKKILSISPSTQEKVKATFKFHLGWLSKIFWSPFLLLFTKIFDYSIPAWFTSIDLKCLNASLHHIPSETTARNDILKSIQKPTINSSKVRRRKKKLPKICNVNTFLDYSLEASLHPGFFLFDERCVKCEIHKKE